MSLQKWKARKEKNFGDFLMPHDSFGVFVIFGHKFLLLLFFGFYREESKKEKNNISLCKKVVRGNQRFIINWHSSHFVFLCLFFLSFVR